MLAYVKRTTVKTPDLLDARLRHEAQLRGVTILELQPRSPRDLLGTPYVALVKQRQTVQVTERGELVALIVAPHSSMAARDRLVSDGLLLAAPHRGSGLPEPLPAVGPSYAELLDRERDERL